MKSFMKESIDFLVSNIDQIYQFNADLINLNNKILKELAEKLPIDKLDAIKDNKTYKDNFIGTIFRIKIELLVKNGNYLNKCSKCNMLFTTNQFNYLYCP